MARPTWTHLRSLILRRAPSAGHELTDAVLLRRFVSDRDQAAFELLVWRHGGLVFGACERILKESNAAEDAFQATFLILARKASTVRGSLPAWLHRCARRVAVRAAQWRTTRREEPLEFELTAKASKEPDPELRSVLDSEIDRLPARLREAVILCYLDGRTTEEAAEILGIPRGTVLSRLSTARHRLSSRLRLRGVTLTAAGLTVGTQQFSNAGRVEACASAAIRYASGISEPSVAFQLANGALAMNARKLVVLWGMTLVVVSGLATGVGVSASGPGPQVAASPAPPVPVAAKPADPIPPAPPVTQPIDPKTERDHRLQALTRAIAELDALQKSREYQMQGMLKASGLLKPELLNPIILKALGEVYSQAEIKAFQLELEIQPVESKIRSLTERFNETKRKLTRDEVEIEVKKYAKDPRVKALIDLQEQLAGMEKVPNRNQAEIVAIGERIASARIAIAKGENLYQLAEDNIADKKSGAVYSKIYVLEEEIKPKLEQRRELLLRREELRKRIEEASEIATLVEGMNREIQIFRDQSRQLRQEKFELEYRLTKRSHGDEQLERILKELAALRADVQTLKEAKK